MAQDVNVPDVIARARRVADVETTTESTSIVTDDELLDQLNQGRRELFDLIAEQVGEEYFATSTSVGPSSWEVPEDFYRELGIDMDGFGINPMSAQRFNFQERNRFIWPPDFPRYRIQNGVITWKPEAPTSAVTLWYIQTPEDLEDDGTFNAFNGWDDYLVRYLVLFILEKQEYPTEAAATRFARAEARVRRSAVRLSAMGDTVSDVRGGCDEDYYNS